MSEEKAIKIVAQPALTKIGDRSVSTIGFRTPLALQHLTEDHNETEWCSPECMGKVMFGRKTARNSESIRKRIPNIVKGFLSKGLFLVVEYNWSKHGQIQAMKIYQGEGGLEKQAAIIQLDRMKRRKELTDANIRAASTILGIEWPKD